MEKKVAFRVIAHTRGDEKVFVCGSCPELGNWTICNSLELKRGEKDEWYNELTVATDDAFEYLFFIGLQLSKDGKFVVKRWETDFRRQIKPSLSSADQLHVFGELESLTGSMEVQTGCLIRCSAIHVIIDGDAFKFWGTRNKNRKFSYKLTAINFDDKTNFSEIDIAVLNDSNHLFKLQNKLGHEYDQNELVMFQLFTCEAHNMGLCFSFYELENEKLFGTAFFVIEKTLMQPSPDYHFDFRRNWTNFKSQMARGVHVGHKGSGNHRRDDTAASVVENTIASINYAIDHGADMVEFDVLLTKDKVPVLFHDFEVDVALNKRKSKENELMTLRVHDLSYNQLHTLQVSPVSHGNKKFEVLDADKPDNLPFCSLESVFHAAKPVPFNIEIKYPTFDDKDIDMNEYVDIILKTVFQHAGNREIIFSCFDPNVCSMLRLKQNKYFVLFLTRGETKKLPHPTDRRMSTVEMATYFAQCMNFAGICCAVGDLINEIPLIDFVTTRNLLLFCFGDDINDYKVVTKLAKAGVHGIIYDRIDKILPQELQSKNKK
ncbi:glycerophosphocholine phosphodiesterase GPCPD1-like protein [Dinothrombium tinctorium]|uniref:Glycerophosphocholine phosphodiesterase GPCPD1-like protein n=1 Tax=Dinothrombium tinctorium TaxID=1965070 RepID=A0A443QIJ9_9ACAR|nr:glycerophosphocholine phosphodiesterase GPCPD1-like protein [Dinothrombium tinctorium]